MHPNIFLTIDSSLGTCSKWFLSWWYSGCYGSSSSISLYIFSSATMAMNLSTVVTILNVFRLLYSSWVRFRNCALFCHFTMLIVLAFILFCTSLFFDSLIGIFFSSFSWEFSKTLPHSFFYHLLPSCWLSYQ